MSKGAEQPGSCGPFAHSANSRGEWHKLSTHLEEVADLARRFGEPFGAGDWAYLAGLWHDAGKGSAAFQAYLRGNSDKDFHVAELRGSVDHTSAGAQHAVCALPVLGHLLAYAIAGHHSGLLDSIGDGACLDRRLRKAVEPWLPNSAPLPEVVPPELPRFLRDALARRNSHAKETAFTFAFFVRMLFSCLVDADFLDTERFLDPERRAARPVWTADILERMEAALDGFVSGLELEGTDVDSARREVREACLAAARQQPGLFSLTVPTGGGKTLSSLAFALRHARLHHLRRVVYVVPFTSIIEQNADVFRRVCEPLVSGGLSDPVLEHHSTVDLDEAGAAARLATENWDAPLVITTSVQFYESLFGCRTSRCRKLHNLAGAVIILDEAQKLPVGLLQPGLLALHELATNYGATVVLCTATQPAIHKRPDFPIGLEGVREIISQPEALYVALKRVDVVDAGDLSDAVLVERLRAERQVLCIVNTRRHARGLFRPLEDEDGTIHLSAAMCPQHRSEVLKDVRQRLAGGEPCRVVSTQLVEAGVDVDFPVVYRSLAGLDSIAQAAGRCNRNARHRQGVTYVFRSEHGRSEAFLRDTANVAAQLLGGPGREPLYGDLLSLASVEHYFRLYYWGQQDCWDSRSVIDRMRLANDTALPFLFDFREIAQRFRLIEDAGATIFIPWGERGRALCGELAQPWARPSTQLLRRLQRYVVQVPRRQWMAALDRGIDLVHDKFAILTCPELSYDRRLGLVLGDEDPDAENFVL